MKTKIIFIAMFIIASSCAFAQERSFTRDFFKFINTMDEGYYQSENANLTVQKEACNISESSNESILIYWTGANDGLWKKNPSEKTISAYGGAFDCQYIVFTNGNMTKYQHFNTDEGFFNIQGKEKSKMSNKEITEFKENVSRFFKLKWKKSN